MKKEKKNKIEKYKTKRDNKNSEAVIINEDEKISFENLEYFRDAYCYFTYSGKNIYTTYSLPDLENKNGRIYKCNCSSYWKSQKICKHIMSLKNLFEEADSSKCYYNYRTLEKTHWYELAKLLVGKDYTDVKNCKLDNKNESETVILNSRQQPVINYFGLNANDRKRFRDRYIISKDSISRGRVLDELYLLFLSDSEKMIISSGNITPRLVFEPSIWYRFAYHLHNEFQDNIRFMLSTDEAGTSFQLNGFLENVHIFSCLLPTAQKNKILNIVQNYVVEKLPQSSTVHKGCVTYSMKLNEKGGINIKPLINLTDEAGNETVKKVQFVPAFNHKVYINNIGFVDLQSDTDMPETLIFNEMTIPVNDVPEFIQKCGEKFLKSKKHDIDPVLRELKIYRTFSEELNIDIKAIESDWCDFNVNIPMGSTKIPLYEIIKLKQSKARYYKIQNGWIDCESEEVKKLADNIEAVDISEFNSEGIKVSKIEMLKLLSVLPCSSESKNADNKYEKFIKLQPVHSDFELKSMKCKLRHYQEIGLKWLTFLAENNFGGLLCDDMGLGKTHQIMALMALFDEKIHEEKPYLVVCPTTVISHWQEKIAKFTPNLKTIIYHGQERELESKFTSVDVIVTSYGVLRNDIHKLCEIDFAFAVFDEIQYLKNKNTISYKAVKQLKFARGFGLSGTPIENRISELKSLMDVVLPGYLGSDYSFNNNYIRPIENQGNKTLQARLAKIVSPFILRRLKETVLKELPPKIEDIRTCELSSEQAELYRQALSTQGKELKKKLDEAKSEKDIPYLHIFALLGLLKQICNHPALVAEKTKNYDNYKSGKWELFKEILTECLESGHKVVVFTQFLGMIDIMEQFLKEQSVSYVSLTGKSTKRGEIIKKFNEDNECRVFLGSLKAGGTGIDLVSASIVIHYDRWWNSAREDQATDRVHRIGQTRGVQVFKFITKNTLEEKISKIIERKKKLMNSIVKEDEADTLKIFSKTELYEILSDF